VRSHGSEVRRIASPERPISELTRLVCNGLVLVDLNLDTLFRLELGHFDLGKDLLEELGVTLALQAVVECVKVSGSDNVVEHDRLNESFQS
jgi:hypothetical protein